MSVPLDTLATIGAIVANVGVVAAATVRIVSANRKSVNESEGRIALQINGLDVRAARLETKMQRAETDIQNIFNAMPKRANDK